MGVKMVGEGGKEDTIVFKKSFGRKVTHRFLLVSFS